MADNFESDEAKAPELKLGKAGNWPSSISRNIFTSILRIKEKENALLNVFSLHLVSLLHELCLNTSACPQIECFLTTLNLPYASSSFADPKQALGFIRFFQRLPEVMSRSIFKYERKRPH